MDPLFTHSDTSIAQEVRNIYRLLTVLFKKGFIATHAETEPSNPQENMVWVKDSTSAVKVWVSGAWVTLG